MTPDTNTASGAAELATRLRNACASVRNKSYPLADLIPLMQQAADALASAAAPLAMTAMQWVSVEDALPEDGQAVLVRFAGENWLHKHKIAGGETRKLWRWQAAWFVRGRTAQEAVAAGVSRSEDELGNNRRPYCWRQFGPGFLFGQDVTHWAAISDPCEETPNAM